MGDCGQGGLLDPAIAVAAAPPPCAEAQLTFLGKMQRLFAEGDFTATYKFALLISLADLAVEVGADDGDALSLTTRQIAERFTQLYWRQATPYGNGRPGTSPAVLVQNTGPGQAAVVSALSAFRASCSAATPDLARVHVGYKALVSSVAQTVSAQPLTYLQNFGGITDDFLYERPGPGQVRLRPGVSYCLRRFHPLVQQLSRAHWVSHVKGNRRNHGVLGDSDDLEDFLFCASRQSLLLMGAGLRKIDGGACFYCGHAFASADVDHFIPFSLYSRDLAHNFVLAHPACNRSKSDALAARPHLERWLERLVRRSDAIAEVGREAGMVADTAASRQVAGWGYTIALQSGGHAWLAASQYVPIDSSYRALLESLGA